VLVDVAARIMILRLPIDVLHPKCDDIPQEYSAVEDLHRRDASGPYPSATLRAA